VEKYCNSHEYRARKNLPLEMPLRPRGQTPSERLREAALAYAESSFVGPVWEDPAWHRLRMAARAFAKPQRESNSNQQGA
jgi:hypothetical protein